MATQGPVLKAARAFSGWLIAAAVLFIVLGAFAIIEPAVTHPLLALGTLTLLLAGLILAAGVCEIVTYFRLRGEQASGWMLTGRRLIRHATA
jgi:uncharacterized membrane protein HdeD (DUF308 family)